MDWAALQSESLRQRLERHSIPEPNSGCLLWQGSATKNGYGWVRWNGARLIAHRASWEDANGQPIPQGMCVLHKCDVPACINPDHLSIGTQSENLADMAKKGRAKYGKRRGGKPSWNVKLTKADVLSIRCDPRPTAALALVYGVAPRYLRHLRSAANPRNV